MNPTIAFGPQPCNGSSEPENYKKYIVGDAQPPQLSDSTKDDDDNSYAKYRSKLEDWDNDDSKTITWFSNTSVLSIHSLFTPFETAKEVYDYLSKRYSSIDGAKEY